MLINDDATLRTYIPNTLATCEGEQTLFDKLDFYLSAAERWLADNVTGVERLVTITAYTAENEIRQLACQIVAADAFRHAIPSLDLVLTANGFGIVNTNNIAPASSDRVKALVESLVTNRDRAIHQLLMRLAKDEDWRSSELGQYFGSTLFQGLDLVTLTGRTDKVWHNYRAMRQSVVLMEDELAEKYISEEVYTRLRQHVLSGGVTSVERPIVEALRAIELELLKGEPLNYPRIISLVQTIRSKPMDFPEWQTSSTAMYFCRPSFQNKKENGGYWW